MENSIYLGLSRQVALQTDMNIIANNVANANTTGYRAQNLLFSEYISAPKGADDELSFVYNEGQYQNTTPGSINTTGNQLDIALEGPGYIGILGPGGGTVYTRDGHFEAQADGTLVTAAGFPVSAQGGGTITIPQGSTEVNIDKQGVVSNQEGIVGQISINEFQNLQDLEPIGNNLYRTDAVPAAAATETTVLQGALERSNVKTVLEVTRMIDTLRSFQNVQQLLQSENERMGSMIERLTRAN